jgi:hypothetical protein
MPLSRTYVIVLIKPGKVLEPTVRCFTTSYPKWGAVPLCALIALLEKESEVRLYRSFLYLLEIDR